MNIKDHGVLLEPNKSQSRVQCSYCNKVVQTYYRLRYHLGNVRKDVTPCEQVPPNVKEAFRQIVMEQISLKNSKSLKHASGQGSSSRTVSPPENEIIDVEIQDLVSNKARKSIARFFYENCVDFSAVDSPSFKEMMNVCGAQMGLKDLKGWMLEEELRQVQDHVKKVKDSWATTGCSILLDAWVDQRGHDLVAFIADSPAGPVYLKSFHVSDIKNNDNDLLSLVNEIVEEAGVENVTQIIVDSTSGWVGELGNLFVAVHNRPQVFWSASVSHWFQLVLEKIGKIHLFEDILEKVNNIWKFINNNASVLRAFRDHSHGEVITVSSSEFEFATPYLTLETIYEAKKILTAMFASSDWNKEEDQGIAISNLVNDSSFWKTVERVVKCTSPLTHGLVWFSSAKNQHVGCVYEKLKGIKKRIAGNFAKEEQFYKPLLDVVDDTWKEHLRSPLHTAGYYLNPDVFYSNDFDLDQEVSVGITSSLVYMVASFHTQVYIAKQLNKYTWGREYFNEALQADQISGISPAEWWAQKASHYPELQSFAVKILSQTCEGASRYKLKRSLAEKLLLTQGMSHFEKQNLEDLAYVHYNLHLQSQTK